MLPIISLRVEKSLSGVAEQLLLAATVDMANLDISGTYFPWSYRESDLLTKLETAQLVETVTTSDAIESWIDARRTARTWWRVDTASNVAREQFAFSDAAADQHDTVIASNDAGCAYPWPLKVGMKFECTENTLWPNGWKVRYDLKFTVEAAESVDMPAGRFDTLRLASPTTRPPMRSAARSASSGSHLRQSARSSKRSARS